MTYSLNIWKISSLCIGALSLAIVINSRVSILPVSSLTFALSCVSVWFMSMCVGLFALHKLMQCKEPISSDFLNKIIIGAKRATHKEPPKVNTKNLKKLVTDIDKYFISKWYVNISPDSSFAAETKIFAEESLSRLISVQLQANNKILLLGVLNIYLKHLKEFRRTLKRREKYGSVEIQELYRYAHVYSNATTNKPKEFYILQLSTTLLRHFINSELWNSLPCHILVAVLARKFTAYLLNMISNPDFLNYVILASIVPKNIKDKLNLDDYGRISLKNCLNVVDNDGGDSKNKENGKVLNSEQFTTEIDSNINETKTEKNTEKLLEQLSSEKTVETILETAPKSGVILRKRKPLKKDTGPTKSDSKSTDSVKIYESKSSTKTWRDKRDLACVSLGQDPLLEGLNLTPPNSANKIGAKFWDSGVRNEDNKNQDSPTTSLFNEVVNMTSIEGLKSSIKPIIDDATERTLHNIKDIQESTETTVHNALQKIEDFQVIELSDLEATTSTHHMNPKQLKGAKYPFHVPPHSLLYSSIVVNQGHISSTTSTIGQQDQSLSKDEAVGVVEGILDFGRAGFRKGLQLTGLQENIETAKATLNNNASKPKEKCLEKAIIAKPGKFSTSSLFHSDEKFGSVDSAKSVDESCWINPILQNNFDGHIFFDKPILDGSSKSAKLDEISIPSISTDHAPSGTNSPDPEYEDAADLASSIAKLRSLLQQRSSESSLSTPALSPMPDEYKQMESEATSAVEVDGVMPSFYKFCTKTASGVLTNTINTIKTALPGNNNGTTLNLDTWMFRADLAESDVLVRMKKLLTERKEYCILDKDIDNAYEAIDSIDFCQSSPIISSLQFEDELDEFELKIPVTKTLVDIFCELMADTNSAFIQEPAVKAFLLIMGNPIEKVFEQNIEAFREYFAENLVTIPEKTNVNSLSMDFQEYVDVICDSLPDTAKTLLGTTSLKSAISLLVSSIQTQKINQDIVLQVFELIAMKLIEESATPPVSA